PPLLASPSPWGSSPPGAGRSVPRLSHRRSRANSTPSWTDRVSSARPSRSSARPAPSPPRGQGEGARGTRQNKEANWLLAPRRVPHHDAHVLAEREGAVILNGTWKIPSVVKAP